MKSKEFIEEIMYDIIIIGAGPAGLSAAIYGAAKSTLVLEGNAYGGQIINTPDVENYPVVAHISGFEFATNLYNQASALGAEIKFEKALEISDGEIKTVKTASGEYEAKAVIIATGSRNRKLGLDKEEQLTGKGVSYCATCDGNFYRNKPVAVVGGGNTAIEDALYLADIASSVYLIHRRDAFRAEQASVDALKKKDNVEFVLNSVVTKLLFDVKLNGVEVEDKSGNSKIIQTDALFVAVGRIPENEEFKAVVKTDSEGYIIAGEDCKTKSAGIFVAGDNRTKEVRQLVTAASDGAVAATAAINYLNTI